jgi:preprotein translocase subunit SecE
MAPQGVLKIHERMEANASAKTKNPFVWLARYLRESKEELEKVAWPTRQETLRYSVLVIGACVLMGLFFAGLDYVLSLGLTKLIEASR